MSNVKTLNLLEAVKKNTAKEFIVENPKGEAEVVSKAAALQRVEQGKASQVVPKPIQHDIIDGATTAETYLQREFPYMLEFFQSKSIENPQITYDLTTRGGKFLQVDFPLPEFAVLSDGRRIKMPYHVERMVFILNNYPDMPPIGFHITKQSELKKEFDDIFQTHKYDSALLEQESVKQALQWDWYWICFHYKNNQWHFDRTDIRRGDSLTYFMHYIYYRIKGVKGISHE